MASALKWSSPASAVTVINGDGSAPTLKNLASAGQKLGNVVDNATDKNRWAAFDLYCRFASSPSVGGYVALYLVPSVDGTDYGDGDDSVAPPTTYLAGVFPVRAVSTQQRVELHSVSIPPFKFKPLVINSSGQAMTNTDNENVLKIRTYNEESQ